ALSVRAHPGIKGVRGGETEHKLLLYADDILAVVSDPLSSLPHLMDTIRSEKMISFTNMQHKYNQKSEAMPLSRPCTPFMVEKFNFKSVRKGMKYLGIKLSDEISEMVALNFNPLLQKIKTNLDKWGKLKLTLWGKIDVVKMIVAPQFGYVAMMLPMRIPSSTFRQLDDMIGHFLWAGKRPRIKLRKLCTHMEKGGLGLPDLRLYYLAFEMAKIARYWQTSGNNVAWTEVEKEICSC
uniref:Reverse transcriptase domain-containing protein n=1 Tax=Seriola lalandi dorsalis TaxID=1841481 RepID=A0A3B4YJP5_SERLL